MRSIYLDLKCDILTFTTRRQMAANGVLNKIWTTSNARLGMRSSIEVCFPNFRTVKFTFSSSLKVRNVKVRRSYPCLTSHYQDKGLSALADELELLCKFLFRLLHPYEQFQSLQIPSAPDLFIRPANIVSKGFHLQSPGFIPSRFKFFLESLRFAANNN